MHAASVYPEPGSNSLKFVYHWLPPIHILDRFFLSFFYFVSGLYFFGFLSSKDLTKSLCVISHFLSLYSRSLPLDRSRSFSLFNFQGPISLCRSLQKRDLLILSRLLRFVNTFFIFFCYLLPPYFFALFFSSLSLAADFHSTTSPLLLSIYF